MPIGNANFYNLQSTRNYPLADDATMTGDDGARLPGFVLADCHLRWPGSLGRYAFVAGLTITPRLVTVVIMAADDPDGAGGFTPLAAMTQQQPVDENRPYNLQPLTPGVGGYLVLGSVNDPCALRFSTPRQGLLASKCARPYTELPVPTLRKLGGVDALQGLVRIIPGTDVEIVKEDVEIAGFDDPVPALVIRLVQTIPNHNVLSAYIGPCDVRPESRNCDAEGIETINGVAPDCDGDLTIDIVGVAHGALAACGSFDAGLVIEGSTGMEEVCLAQGAPDFVQGEDTCPPTVFEEPVYSLSSEGGHISAWPWALAAPAPAPRVALAHVWPVFSCFEQADDEGYVTKHGSFLFEDDDYAATDASRRNVAVWEGFQPGTSLDKRCTVTLSLTAQSPQRNGGIVLNYREVDHFWNPHAEYFLVAVDQTIGAVLVLRYTGVMLVEEYRVLVGAMPDGPYTLVVTTQPGTVGQVLLDVALTGPRQAHFSFSTARFGTPEGAFGIGTDRAHTRFHSFSLEDR